MQMTRLPNRLMLFVPACLMAVGLAGCNYSYLGSPTSPSDSTTSTTTPSTSTTTTPAPGTNTGTSTLTYVKDVQPILSSDCTRCHGASRRDGGVDLSTYTGVMHVVTPGSAASRLVVATTQGGSMYSQLSGSRATKSTTIRTWVVSANAVQQ